MNGSPTGSQPRPDRTAGLATSPLGDASHWPQSLPTAIDISSLAMPMLLLWGTNSRKSTTTGLPCCRHKHPRLRPADTRGLAGAATLHRADYSAVLTARCAPQQQRLSCSATTAIRNLAGPDYSPIRDERGRVAGILVTAIETNERRQLAEELQQRSEASLKAQHNTEQRLQLALAATDAVGTWDWDISEDRFIADSHFAQLHGVDPAKARQLPISDYLQGVHPEDRGMVARSIKHCISHGSEYAEEYRLLQADGQVRWVFARGRCYKDHHGRPVRFLGAALDLPRVRTGRRDRARVGDEGRRRLEAPSDGHRESRRAPAASRPAGGRRR